MVLIDSLGPLYSAVTSKRIGVYCLQALHWPLLPLLSQLVGSRPRRSRSHKPKSFSHFLPMNLFLRFSFWIDSWNGAFVSVWQRIRLRSANWQTCFTDNFEAPLLLSFSVQPPFHFQGSMDVQLPLISHPRVIHSDLDLACVSPSVRVCLLRMCFRVVTNQSLKH